MKIRIACLMALLSLTACFRHSPEDSINYVKEQESTVRGFTFGQILESKKFCKTKSWSASQDEFGRDIVTFDCGIELSKDTVDKLASDADASLERRAAEKASECNADPKPFVNAAGPKLESYFGQFASATVRPVFVIYKRELVDATVLLLDATGTVVKTSQQSKSLLATNFVKVNSPYEADADIGPVYAAITYSAPTSNFTCIDLRRAAKDAEARAAEAADIPASGVFSAAVPASAPVEPDLRQTLGLVPNRKN